MPDTEADTAARRLIAEHDARQPYRGVEPWPADAGEAYVYDVQDRLTALRLARSGRIAGYKIGLTTPVMQKLCHGDRPIAGAMFESGIRTSPATIRASDFVRLGIESELAVRIGRPLPAGKGRLGRGDIAPCIAEIATAFELIEDRGADYATLDWRGMAADNSWHGGLVLAEAVPMRDIADLKGALEIDGKPAGEGSTRDVLGHPLEAVAWLAAHLAARGQRLEPGQWVSTGSIAPIRHATAGQRFRFIIAGLPPVEARVV